MNLYKIHPKADYLSVLADFIIKNFKDNLGDLKVILPTGSACNELLKILVKKQVTTFLPSTISFSDILAEGEEIFKIPTEEIVKVSYLEQKIILAEIISNFDKLDLSVIQSLKFTDSLANLFHQLDCNQIPLSRIQNLSTENHAKHWQFIYEFLNYAYENWQAKLKSLKKTSHAEYQTTMLKSEATRLKLTNKSFILVAGIFGHDHITWQFLKEIAQAPKGYIVLPPLPDFEDSTITEELDNPDEPLYPLNELLKTLNKNLSDFKYVESCEQLCTLDTFLLPTGIQVKVGSQNNHHIKYQEFEDIFSEAEAISTFCAENKDKKIAIIVRNEKAKEFYNNFLIKRLLDFQDQFGINLAKVNISKIIINVSEILYSDFDLTKLFILLKNPLINSENVIKLEKLLSNKNRFVSRFAQISKVVELAENTELNDWWLAIADAFSAGQNEDSSFAELIRRTILVAEKIRKDLWQSVYGFEVSQFFIELIKLNTNLSINKLEDFPVILKTLMAGARVFNHQKESNVMICKPNDALFSKFDLVILADFSEGNWPLSFQASQWLNKQMEEELKLYLSRINLSATLYQFYLLLHNTEVIITRSIKQMNNIELLTSSYIMKLQHLVPETIILLNHHIPLYSSISYSELNPITYSAQASIFPATLSATDIEILIRSPYSFYAKKILGLRKYESIAAHPKLSEFGSFIHNIIEHYTKNYIKNSDNKLGSFLAIGNQMLEQALLPVYTKKIWRVKFSAVAEEFIKFDEELRTSNSQTFSEIRGETKLKIHDQDIKITAIADRIEVNDQGIATILDYKTGALPTKKDVLSGMSPQLIIEAIILLAGGFNIKPCGVEKLIYVKIASSEPFIQTVEINITKEQLKEHIQGLQGLLEHYMNIKAFPTDIDHLKYNDYIHLARK